MKNQKLIFLALTFAITFALSFGIFLYFTQVNEAKIFGCTQYDVYEGELEHTKLPPIDTYCTLRNMNLSFGEQDLTLAGLVEYDLNLIGYLTIFLTFIVFPFILSYSGILILNKFLTRNVKVEQKV